MGSGAAVGKHPVGGWARALGFSGVWGKLEKDGDFSAGWREFFFWKMRNSKWGMRREVSHSGTANTEGGGLGENAGWGGGAAEG